MSSPRRHAFKFVLALALFTNAPLASASPSAMPDVPTVFITATGQKYHRASCRHLKHSRKELTLDEAKRRGYTPCGVCQPPQ